MLYFASFNRFELAMTLEEAQLGSHPGPCDDDVSFLVGTPIILAQLEEIDPSDIRDELREYGAWDEEELTDDEQNRHRIVWEAANRISEECFMAGITN